MESRVAWKLVSLLKTIGQKEHTVFLSFHVKSGELISEE
jgi:hypothetical protein